jgi:hypothetical protein
LLFWRFGAAGSGLLRLPLDGDAVPVPFLEGAPRDGRLSPDAQWLVYASAESGRSEIYAVPFPTASRKLQISSAGGSQPRWRGREILYLGRDNKLMAVSIAHRDGDIDVGAPMPLFEARPVGPRSFYDVSPDGQSFLVNVLTGEGLSSSITLVQNWDVVPGP